MVRCTNCRDYFPKHEYSNGVGGVCSEECLLALQKRRNFARGSQSKSPKPKTSVEGSVASEGNKRIRHNAPLHARTAVKKRDGGRCVWCGYADVPLQVHHINYRSEGLDNSYHNLITLCAKHHNAVHSNKRKYQPILRGIIWKFYVDKVKISVPEFERRFWPAYEARYPPIKKLKRDRLPEDGIEKEKNSR
jgi:hypothetical protein